MKSVVNPNLTILKNAVGKNSANSVNLHIVMLPRSQMNIFHVESVQQRSKIVNVISGTFQNYVQNDGPVVSVVKSCSLPKDLETSIDVENISA